MSYQKNRHGLPIITASIKRKVSPEVWGISLEEQLRDTVFSKTNEKCFYCGTTITRKHFTIDHVIPRKKGGTDLITNLVPACSYCNGLKAAMLLEEFRDVFEQVFGHRVFEGEKDVS